MQGEHESDHLLNVLLVVVQAEVDVCVNAAELDRSLVVGPEINQMGQRRSLFFRICVVKRMCSLISFFQDRKQCAGLYYQALSITNLAAACAVSNPPEKTKEQKGKNRVMNRALRN
jgi:hypothetical protein